MRAGIVVMQMLAVAALGAACRPKTGSVAYGAAPSADAGGAAFPDGEWAAYGRDAYGSRYSPLTQITRENVARLRPAWTYRTGESAPAFATARTAKFEATPLVVDGAMYLSTPLGRVIALDPATGRERWVFEPSPKVDRALRFGDFASRGVSTWVDPAAAPGAPCRRRIYIATIDARLIALDAARGAPCAGFGDRGTVDLRRGLRNAPFETAEYEVTSPPAVVNGVIVVGSAVADNNRTDAASGEVRAFDARTGAPRWAWDPVPRDSADPAWATWIGPRAHETGAANAWSVIAADPERDLVFVPTGSASPDYFGGERLGDNRYANSVVALRASSGTVAWHFQVVHHDLWDYDVASPPALVTVRRADGTAVPAVLQATKTGQLFVLHRETGVPLFPVEERPVPASDVPGERASPTQPFSSIPALSPHALPPDDAWGPTPALREECRGMIASLRNEGAFTPPSERGTLALPSNVGGAHWGGLAFDPERQVAVVPVNRVAAMVQLIEAEGFDWASARTEGSRLGYEYTRMRGTPYIMRRRLLLSSARTPCSPPPFGGLVAVSLRTGRVLWDVPLGTIPPGLSPALDSALGSTPPALGSINLGGPIATAGGVVFIGATLDRAVRAYDVETGRELWRAQLPAGARATPMTFQLGPDGRQYLVIVAGGGDEFGAGDYVMAFALPE